MVEEGEGEAGAIFDTTHTWSNPDQDGSAVVRLVTDGLNHIVRRVN